MARIAFKMGERFRKYEETVLMHYIYSLPFTTSEWSDLAKQRVKMMDKFVASIGVKELTHTQKTWDRHLSRNHQDEDDLNRRFLRFVNFNISGLEILCVKTRFWKKPIYYIRSVYGYGNLALQK